MKSNSVRAAVILGVLVCAPAAQSQAQQTGPGIQPIVLHELVLKDGSRAYGSVESETDTEVVFRTQTGAVLTARRGDIRSLRRISGSMIDGEFQPADPNGTRLFFAPTGRSLRKGQTYLGIYEFVMPFVQVGVTDRTPLIFGIEDWERPFWVTPKVQLLDTGRTQVAAGVLHAFDSDGDGGGIAYTVLTRGDDARALTAGLGVAYATDGGTSPVFMIGGEGRVRRNMKAITENYIWKDGHGIVSAGVRFFGEKLSADLALAVPIGTDAFFAFPVVNFVYVF
jgi:hypothetical protein